MRRRLLLSRCRVSSSSPFRRSRVKKIHQSVGIRRHRSSDAMKQLRSGITGGPVWSYLLWPTLVSFFCAFEALRLNFLLKGNQRDFTFPSSGKERWNISPRNSNFELKDFKEKVLHQIKSKWKFQSIVCTWTRNESRVGTQKTGSVFVK